MRRLALLGVLAGAALRVWMVAGPRGQLDSDEAVVGLMARHFLDGDVQAFYWGQHYGGTQETALAAGVFAVAGPSVLALKAVPLALSAVAAVLVWRIGRRVVGERAAAVAGLAAWVWPASSVWWSARERGFYWACLVSGLVVVLCALRIGEGEGRRLDRVALGLAAGLGWWASPHIVFFVAPAGLWLLATRPRSLLDAWPAVPAAVVGALPWLWHNVENGWASLDAPPQPVETGFVDRLEVFAEKAAPMAMGLRQPFTEAWLVDAVAPALYVVAAVGVVVLVVGLARHPGPGRLLALAVVAFPFLYAAFPTAWFVGEGRYGVFLVPYLALLVGLACRPFAERPPVAGAVLALLFVASAVSVGRIRASEPVRVDDDLAVLEAGGVDRVWADYWLAYRLTFESDERLVATPPIYHRHQPYADQVAASPVPAFLFQQGDETEPEFRRELERLGVAARRIRTDDFVVYVPERRVEVTELAPIARP